MPKSDLPFGSEFSPSQINLRAVLELAHKHGGDWHAFEAAVRRAYFADNKTSDYNKGKLANNCKLGMIAYGLIDREARLTPLGEKLHAMRTDESAMVTELARHLLMRLNGTMFVQCILDMHAAAETIDLLKLRQWLQERGIHFPRGGKHPSIMRLWLEKAGIFTGGWRVDEGRFKEILGLTAAEVDTLSAFSEEQRAYLKTLSNMSGPGPYASNDVERLAAETYGVRFNEKNLPKSVLYPLETAGYITLRRGTKKEGRGAKPFMVTPTARLNSEIIIPMLNQLEKQIGGDIRPLLRKPLNEILANLTIEDRHKRGLALEALAFKLMRLVDLSYVATRLRGAATGGAEWI